MCYIVGKNVSSNMLFPFFPQLLSMCIVYLQEEQISRCKEWRSTEVICKTKELVQRKVCKESTSELTDATLYLEKPLIMTHQLDTSIVIDGGTCKLFLFMIHANCFLLTAYDHPQTMGDFLLLPLFLFVHPRGVYRIFFPPEKEAGIGHEMMINSPLTLILIAVNIGYLNFEVLPSASFCL